MHSNQTMVDRNYEAFLNELPKFIHSHAGKFALLHDAKIIDFFDTAGDTAIAGRLLYKEHDFSIQKVTTIAVDLGYFSYA